MKNQNLEIVKLQNKIIPYIDIQTNQYDLKIAIQNQGLGSMTVNKILFLRDFKENDINKFNSDEIDAHLTFFENPYQIFECYLNHLKSSGLIVFVNTAKYHALASNTEKEILSIKIKDEHLSTEITDAFKETREEISRYHIHIECRDIFDELYKFTADLSFIEKYFKT